MRGIVAQKVGAQQDQSDRAVAARRVGSAITRQDTQALRDLLRVARVIDAGFGIFARRIGFDETLAARTRASGIAVDQRAHHGHHVLIRTRKPILQRQEIGAHILRGAWNEFEDFGETPQHLHLASARAGRALFRRSAQLLEQRQRPLGGRVHAVIAHARQLDDFARRHQADHGVAVFPARFERRHDPANVVIDEQHCRNDDIGAFDGGLGLSQSGVIKAPLRSRVKRDRYILQPEQNIGPFDRAFQVVVERNNGYAHRRIVAKGAAGRLFGDPGLTVHNAPWRHRAFRDQSRTALAQRRKLRCCGALCRGQKTGFS